MGMNVFADLGFDDPELELAKARIVNTLQDVMEEKEMAEPEAAELMKVPTLGLHELLRGQWENIPISRLIEFVHTLDASIRFDPETGKIVDEADVPLALTA